jgi:quinol monooxygenase YgiN
MIHASIRMKFAAKEFAEAREILGPLVEQTRVNTGCLECHIYQDMQEDRVLVFEQLWEGEADLNQHLRSDLYHQVILVMELAEEFPVVRFSDISRTTGMETIERSRRVAKETLLP